CLAGAIQRRGGHRQLPPRFGIGRVETHRLLQAAQRLLVPTELDERDSGTLVRRRRSGVETRRDAERPKRVLRALELEEHPAEDLMAARLLGAELHEPLVCMERVTLAASFVVCLREGKDALWA